MEDRIYGLGVEHRKKEYLMNKEITFEECKRLMVDIMANVAHFCDKHDIRYSLSYGTLIGAIRHKGFIPWDDDIDIIMWRDDYERFVSTYKDERYQIIDGSFNINHSHIRVSDQKTILRLDELRGQFYKYGLWIDVFPIDKVPDSEKKYNRFLKKLWFLFKMQSLGEVHRKGFINIKKLVYFICRPFHSFFGKWALKTMKKYNNSNTHSVSDLGSWYNTPLHFPYSYMDEYVDVEFEGHKFKAIKQYDAFLRGMYGDYMQFPPIEMQKPHHSYTAYWRE